MIGQLKVQSKNLDLTGCKLRLQGVNKLVEQAKCSCRRAGVLERLIHLSLFKAVENELFVARLQAQE